MKTKPLSNIQLEILTLYSTNLSLKDLKEIKLIIAKFYADRAIQEADKIWDNKNLTNQDMEKWIIEESTEVCY